MLNRAFLLFILNCLFRFSGNKSADAIFLVTFSYYLRKWLCLLLLTHVFVDNLDISEIIWSVYFAKWSVKRLTSPWCFLYYWNCFSSQGSLLCADFSSACFSNGVLETKDVCVVEIPTLNRSWYEKINSSKILLYKLIICPNQIVRFQVAIVSCL